MSKPETGSERFSAVKVRWLIGFQCAGGESSHFLHVDP
jgi:hypothetical protein